jgi:tyrosyl-tRNA synthetase
MSIPDALMENYFTLLTELPAEEISKLLDPDRTHPRQAKATLGKMIVATYHDEQAAAAATAEFDRVFAQKETPTEMPDISVSKSKINIVELICQAGFAKSKSDARRLVSQNAVSIDDEKITDIDAEVTLKSGCILRVGKRRFGRIVV